VTYFDPEDGGSIYLLEVGNTVHIHTMERPKSAINILNVGFEVFTEVVMKSIVFWDMTPCSSLCSNRCFGGTKRLHLQGRRKVQQTNEQSGGTLLDFSSTLKIEALCSSETSVATQRTTRRHIPEDDTLRI
jgi:hypothetical protein